MAFRGCEICKRPIEPERAANDPRTQLCVEHGAEVLQYGGEFRRKVTKEPTAKGWDKGGAVGLSVDFERNEEAIEKLKAVYEARGRK